MENNICVTRRSFFKGLGTIGILPAAAALAGHAVAPSSAVADEAAAPTQDTVDVAAWQESEGLPGNPNYQVPESEYGTADLPLDMLFSPIEISGKTLRNRICKSGAGAPGDFDANGFPSEQILTFYEDIAKGGAGYVIVDTNSMPVEALKVVADRVHAQGALVGMQHYRMDNWMPGGICSSATAVTTGPLDFSSSMPVMADAEDVQGIIDSFVCRAMDAYEAGFDGFDINAGCNHLLDTFLSRVYNNQRDDDYGPQSLENRARVITDIVRGIREHVGDEFIVSVLFNGLETDVYDLGDDEGCTTVEEAVGFAKLFEEAGASMLHVRWGAHGNHAAAFFPDRLYIGEPGATGYEGVLDWPRGAMGPWEWRYEGAMAAVPLAARIKQAVNIPVATVGCMDPRLAPDLAEKALEDGSIDLLMMTRPLMADPDLPHKLQEGRRDEIAPCTHCETCFMSNDGCRVNPQFGRTGTDEMPGGHDEYPQTAQPKRVLVVGGGPAGMEAARVAALCGHSVKLCEKTSALGGKLPFAAMVKGSHELIDDYQAYLVRQLEVCGVEVQLDCEITPDNVGDQEADVVMLACGAGYPTPDVPGIADSPIAYSLEAGLACRDQKVVILGHDVQALNMAEYLVKKGCKVTVVNQYGAPAAGVDPAAMAAAGAAEGAGDAMPGAAGDMPEGTPTDDLSDGMPEAAPVGATAGIPEDASAGDTRPQVPVSTGRALGENMASYVVDPTLNWLRKKAVKFYNNAEVLQVGDSSVTIAAEYGVDVEIPCDTVLWADQAGADELACALAAVVPVLVCVGDAAAPKNIGKAVAEAHLIARAL